jgi:hypothetical protein
MLREHKTAAMKIKFSEEHSGLFESYGTIQYGDHPKPWGIEENKGYKTTYQ